MRARCANLCRWTGLVFLLVPGIARVVVAAELSHYSALPGMAFLDDLFLPPPEVGHFVYGQYNSYYGTDTFRDSRGNKVKKITITGPAGRPITIDLDLDVDNWVIAPLLLRARQMRRVWRAGGSSRALIRAVAPPPSGRDEALEKIDSLIRERKPVKIRRRTPLPRRLIREARGSALASRVAAGVKGSATYHSRKGGKPCAME